jgi:GTP-binding protein
LLLLLLLQVKPPTTYPSSPLQMLCANIDYDEHKGRIAIGRVVAGTIKKGQQVSVCSSLEPGVSRKGKVNDLYVYDNFARCVCMQVRCGGGHRLHGMGGDGRQYAYQTQKWPASGI